MRNKKVTHGMIVFSLLFFLYHLSACKERVQVIHIAIANDSTGGSWNEITYEINTEAAADTIRNNITVPIRSRLDTGGMANMNARSLTPPDTGGGAKCTRQIKVWSTFVEEADKTMKSQIPKP